MATTAARISKARFLSNWAQDCSLLRQIGRGEPNPAVSARALEFGFENDELTKAVGEPRVVAGRGGVGDGGVEAAEKLFEGVVVAFAVAAGEIGEGAGGGFEQRGIF